MSAKADILGALRAVGVPARTGPVEAAGSARSGEEQGLVTFVSRLEEVGGRVVQLEPKHLLRVVRQFQGSEAGDSTVVRSGDLPDWVCSALEPGAIEVVRNSERNGWVADDERATFSSGLCFTSCEALIAESGTVVVHESEDCPRWLFMGAEHHVVVAMQSQLVAGFEEALERGCGESVAVWITGPSRTADIEKVLVKPAHGPRHLTVLIILGR